MNTALAGRELELADAPNPRSPLHNRARELQGRTLERAEARGKHLLAHFSGGLVLHSHLGMNGRWRIAADGRLPYGRPGCGSPPAAGSRHRPAASSCAWSRESRAPQRPGPRRSWVPIRSARASRSTRRRAAPAAAGRGREIGDALLDQRLIAGIGNAIRNEACFAARISPWRKVEDLSADELELVVAESERIMRASVAKGRRPRAIYRANRTGGCPSCGGAISSGGQGDDNRTAYWCPVCQA